MTITIKIPFKTPTANHLYYHVPPYGTKCLTREAREIRRIIENEVAEQYMSQIDLHEDEPMTVEVFIKENWYYKNGAVRKSDVANRQKFLIDSVFKALGIDDKLIFVMHMEKVQSKHTEEAIIRITQSKDWIPTDS